MERKSSRLIIALSVWLAMLMMAAPAGGSTIGTPVAIGGHASDLALDEARGVLYVANFTANRIDVVSLSDLRVETSMNVAAQPSAIAMSPDGRHLVVTHFGNFEEPVSANNALTVIDLQTRGRRTFALGAPALGVAFGRSPRALVVTNQDFLLFDPISGALNKLSSIADLVATSLPVPPANFPPNIIMTSMNVSGNGMMIYGLTDTFEFGYDVASGWLRVMNYTSTPPQGPRVVSVNYDGSRYLGGWVLHGNRIWDRATGVWSLAEFINPSGELHIGSHAIDDSRGLVYAQFSSEDNAETNPQLQVLRADNLAILGQLWLPENLAGKSILTEDSSWMYSISDSGVLALPIGEFQSSPQVVSDTEQLLFQSNFCDRNVQTQEILIYDTSGRQTDFYLSADNSGVQVTPQNGTTPATVTVRVDPSAFQLVTGTEEVKISINSGSAINNPKDISVRVNTPDPDQRGTIVSVAGKLVDVIPDPARDRFYILRQDTNEVLVFEGNGYSQIATLSTGNVPTQMAITFDRRWLLVGHDSSQYVAVFDLETLQPSTPIRTPGGHYPRSVAASGSTILTANRNAGPENTIDRINLAARTATQLPSLGVYENNIDESTVMVTSPNGSSIFIAMADGNVMLYNASADTFTISRKDAEELSGAYAASAYDTFVIGERFLNASLVTTTFMETSTGQTSGFAFVEDIGLRTTAPRSSDPGIIQRVDSATGIGTAATRIAEAPLLGTDTFPFTRTIAPLPGRDVIVSLTTSGFTVLPAVFDASIAPPKIGDVVNAAEYTEPVAPGGLVSIFGQDLGVTSQASSQLPLPTALADSCLTVNGIPTPILYVSSTQINAQLPFEVIGNTTLVLRTPGGVSDNYNLTINPTAPAVFQRPTSGSSDVFPTIVRVENGQLVTNSNPIHTEEDIVIYLTGMGRTNPPVPEGTPAPADPPSLLVNEVQLMLGHAPMPIYYAGLAPGQVGVYQINAHVPWWSPQGDAQPLIITQGGGSTTVFVRVVD